MAKLKINLNPSLSRLDLVIRGLTNEKFMGNYGSMFKGLGQEFSGFRVYNPEDDASRIDWKISAKSNNLLVREYVEERGISVFFLVDVSSKMLLGSTEKLKSEFVADFVASLSKAILASGDKVGLALFSDKITKIVYPDMGMKHFFYISESLSDLLSYGGNCNMGKAIDFAVQILNKNAVLFLVSDFLNEEKVDDSLRIAGQKFDMISVIVRDPIDMSLPKGIGNITVEDPVSGERLLANPNKVSKYYSYEVKKQLSKLKRSFIKSNISVLNLNTKEPFMKKITEFMVSRR